MQKNFILFAAWLMRMNDEEENIEKFIEFVFNVAMEWIKFYLLKYDERKKE